MLYVLSGPANCGNVFGYHKINLIPAEKHAIVEDGEYNNGGFGPILWTNILFDSEQDALERISDIISSQTK